MGVMYLNGWGVKPSHRQALECFTIAAQVGHVLGMYNLAVMHLNGRAGLPDVDARLSCPQALALMKKIAEKGSWGGLVQQVWVHLTFLLHLKVASLAFLMGTYGYLSVSQSWVVVMLLVMKTTDMQPSE